MRVVVFGAGAIGSLLGALLSRGGSEVTLVGRAEHVAAIRREGLRVEGTTNETFRLAATEELAEGTETDAVLLTVKAFDLSQASEILARAVRDPVPILALQNGLGIEELIAVGLRRGGSPHLASGVVRGINTIPATLLGPGVVRHAGEGEVVLPAPRGGMNPQPLLLLQQLLESGHVRVRRVEGFARELWRKVLVNAAINPVTADHEVPNGRLLSEPLRHQAERLLREAQQAARAAGYPFSDAEADGNLWTVVRSTAENRSSMLQDIDRGRPTEIEAISGAILEVAEVHGLDLPVTRRAVRRIREKARTRATQPS